jgi:integrase/recombinase XerD
VLDGPSLVVVDKVDAYLRHLRFGRSRAESTTKTYAGHLKRFHQWRLGRRLSWDDAASALLAYVMHLLTTPRSSAGRGQGRPPSDAALAPVLAAIHGFYLHAADVGLVRPATIASRPRTAPCWPPGRFPPRTWRCCRRSRRSTS